MSVQNPVKVVTQLHIGDWGTLTVSVRKSEVKGGPYELWATLGGPDATLIATCGKSKALSEWALNKGAALVRFDFDLSGVE